MGRHLGLSMREKLGRVQKIGDCEQSKLWYAHQLRDYLEGVEIMKLRVFSIVFITCFYNHVKESVGPRFE